MSSSESFLTNIYFRFCCCNHFMTAYVFLSRSPITSRPRVLSILTLQKFNSFNISHPFCLVNIDVTDPRHNSFEKVKLLVSPTCGRSYKTFFESRGVVTGKFSTLRLQSRNLLSQNLPEAYSIHVEMYAQNLTKSLLTSTLSGMEQDKCYRTFMEEIYISPNLKIRKSLL